MKQAKRISRMSAHLNTSKTEATVAVAVQEEGRRGKDFEKVHPKVWLPLSNHISSDTIRLSVGC
jgi:uncharacterized Zn-finger protein